MKWIQNNWLTVLAIVLLLGAVASVPYYAYYQLMSWVVVGAAAMAAWQAYTQGKKVFVWLLALVAVVFNPVAPLYFSASVWQFADIVGAVVFATSLFFVRNKN